LNPVEKSYFSFVLTEFFRQAKNHHTNESVVDAISSMKYSLELILQDDQIQTLDSLPKTYSALAKKIQLFVPPIQKYFYCDCGLIGPIKKENINSKNKIFCGTKKHFIVPKNDLKNNKNYFCYTSVRTKLEYILPIVYENLIFQSKSNADSLMDIRDGQAYKRLSGPDRICLYIGWDGVKVRGQQSGSIWPLVCFIAELPNKLREKF